MSDSANVIIQRYLDGGYLTKQLAKELSDALSGETVGGGGVDLVDIFQNGFFLNLLHPSSKLDVIRFNPSADPDAAGPLTAWDTTTAIRIVKGDHIIDTYSSTTTAGAGGTNQAIANRVVEYGIKGGPSTQSPTSSDIDGASMAGFLGGSYHIKMWMTMAMDGAQFGIPHTSSLPGSPCFCGMELGSFGANAPWSGNAGGAMVQLRQLLSGSSNVISLCTAINGATTPVLTTGTIKDTENVAVDGALIHNTPIYYLLDWYPGSYCDVWVKCLPNGIPLQRVIHLISNVPSIIAPGADGDPLIALVSHSGSGNGGNHMSVSQWGISGEYITPAA